MAWRERSAAEGGGWVDDATGTVTFSPPSRPGGADPGLPPWATGPYEQLYKQYGHNYSKQQYDIDQRKGHPDFQLDERGFPNRLPPAPIAPQVQLDAERKAAERNSRIVKDSLGYLNQGLGNLQTYRPGGAAAMQSPYYQNLASINLADRAEAPDLMFDWRRDEAFQLRRQASQARQRAMIGTVAGVALGAVTGGLGAAALGVTTGAGILGGAMLGGSLGSAIGGGSPAGVTSALGSAAGLAQGLTPAQHGKPQQPVSPTAPTTPGSLPTSAIPEAQITAPAGAGGGGAQWPAGWGGGGAPPGWPGSRTSQAQGTGSQGPGGQGGGPGGPGGGGGGPQGGGGPGGGGPTGMAPAAPAGPFMPMGTGSAGMNPMAVADMLEPRYGLPTDTLYAADAAQRAWFADFMMDRLVALIHEDRVGSSAAAGAY